MSDRIATAVSEAQRERAVLMESLASDPRGGEWCRRLSSVYDNLWREIWLEARNRYVGIPDCSIVATGSYGRQEAAPHSDVDIAFVPEEAGSELESAIRWMFLTAHDVFGKSLNVRLSYVYRLASDLPGLDSVGLSNLLDGRHVAGPSGPFQSLAGAMWAAFPTSDFLNAKLEERRQEYHKTHGTPLVTQPHLKLGAGGLRDFHSSNWIGLAIGERPASAPPEFDFILKIRNLLHLVAGKQLDELNYARREEVAGILGLDSFELGSQIASAMAKIHHQYRLSQKRLTENRYRLGPFAHAVRGEARLEPGSPAGMAAVVLADATRIGLELPTSLPPLKPDAGPEFVTALTSGAKTIRALGATGIFRIAFPELSACEFLMPRDASHQYSVYEHTLKALEQFESIAPGSAMWDVKQQLTDPAALILALLFHDLGKAVPETSHSESGARIALETMQRWELDEALIQTVVWLVREHLTMSQTIRTRDIDLPETVMEFIDGIPDQEALCALTLLTYCDVQSVGPDIWTPVQETYLLTLFERAQHLMQNQDLPDVTESDAAKRVLRNAPNSEMEDLAAFLDAMPAHYLLSTPGESIVQHSRLFSEITEGEVLLDFHDHRDLGLTEVTVAMRDRPGILPEILGVFYSHNLSIQNLRCSTSTGEPAGIIDTFLLSKAGRPVDQRQRRSISQDLRSVLLGEIAVDDLLRQRSKDPSRQQQFFTLEILERDPVILEIRAPKGRGLAFRLSRVISQQGLSILSARLGQWAGSASAGFYVYDPSGRPVDTQALRSAFSGGKP